MAKKKKKPAARGRGEKRLFTGDELKQAFADGSLRIGPLRHQQLGKLTEAWCRDLYRRVGHLLQPTYEQWESGFCRDTHPESEIIVWETIARTWEDVAGERPDAEKRRLLGTIVSISTGAPEDTDNPEWKALDARYVAIREQMRRNPSEMETIRGALIEKGLLEDIG